jgi:hypothetical protein
MTLDVWQPWEALTPTERRRRADTAGFATLRGGAVSKAAQAMIDDLLENTIIPAKAAKAAVRPSSHDKLRAALGAFVCDLLLAAAKGRAVKLSARKEAFTGRNIGRTAFEDVASALKAEGLLEHIKGYRAGMSGPKAPVFCATPILVAAAQRHGIGLERIERDFAVTTPEPLEADA